MIESCSYYEMRVFVNAVRRLRRTAFTYSRLRIRHGFEIRRHHYFYQFQIVTMR
jgi:hypothetical protein